VRIHRKNELIARRREVYDLIVSRTKPPLAASDVKTVEDVLAIVRANGGRSTHARRLLVSALFARDDHMTAEELAAEVHSVAPDVHLSTIYRNLDDLEELGVIAHAHRGHGPATYHLAGRGHGHLVCQSCGDTIDVPDSLFRALVRLASETYGFEVEPHHTAISGRCEACRGA
jgi:Fur family ferric uptake transcriptional regulator